MSFLNSSIVKSTQNVTKTVYNVTIATANVEQSLALSAQILGYLIKTRQGSAELKLSHVSGQSGTNYLTIPRKAVHTDEHPYANLTLYFQSPVAGDVVEVVTWS